MSVGPEEIDAVGKDGRFLLPSEWQKGWSQRIQFISAYEFTRCAACHASVTRRIACCVSIIPPGQMLPEWESHYGKLMSREEVKLYLTLATA